MNEASQTCPGTLQVGSHLHSLTAQPGKATLHTPCLSIPIWESQVVVLNKAAMGKLRTVLTQSQRYGWAQQHPGLSKTSGSRDLEFPVKKQDSILPCGHKEVIQAEDQKHKQDREVCTEKPWRCYREIEFYPCGAERHQPKNKIRLNKIIQNTRIMVKAR